MAVVASLHLPYPSTRFCISRERSLSSLICRVSGGGFEAGRSLCIEFQDIRSIRGAMALSEGVSKRKIPQVLTVAGSDSGAGAGIQADLKACGALGVYCSSVITAVTAQNTLGVQGIHPVPADSVEDQLTSVLSDMEVDVVKTGMLPSVEIIKALCGKLREFNVKALVVDPVMVSTSGDLLAAPATLHAIRNELLPMADLVTPNLKEASALLDGLSLETVPDMFMAARAIHKLGARNVIVKGGHLPDSSDAIDVYFDGEQFHELCGQRVKTRNTHGTGCTLASAIAAELAKGSPMLRAVKVLILDLGLGCNNDSLPIRSGR